MMKIKEIKADTEKKINEALIEFSDKTELKIEEIKFSDDPKIGYDDGKDYRVKIKASTT